MTIQEVWVHARAPLVGVCVVVLVIALWYALFGRFTSDAFDIGDDAKIGNVYY